MRSGICVQGVYLPNARLSLYELVNGKLSYYLVDYVYSLIITYPL